MAEVLVTIRMFDRMSGKYGFAPKIEFPALMACCRANEETDFPLYVAWLFDESYLLAVLLALICPHEIKEAITDKIRHSVSDSVLMESHQSPFCGLLGCFDEWGKETYRQIGIMV